MDQLCTWDAVLRSCRPPTPHFRSYGNLRGSCQRRSAYLLHNNQRFWAQTIWASLNRKGLCSGRLRRVYPSRQKAGTCGYRNV